MTNLLDRVIGAFSPRAGLRREVARARLDRFRAYEAGRLGDREKHWRAPGTGPNAEVGLALSRTRNRARALERDNPHAKRITTTLARHQVGYGITPRSATGDEALDERVDKLHAEWAKKAVVGGQMNLYGWQRLMAKTRSRDGEVLGRLVNLDLRTMRGLGLQVPLQVEAVEADMLADDMDTTLLPGSPRVEQGVEFDIHGRRQAYHFHKSHPGETGWLRVTPDRVVRWPARLVIHLFRAHDERPNQIRGMPDLTPIILRTRRLDDFEDATLEQAKAQAMLGIVWEDADSELGDYEGQRAAAAPQGPSRREEDMLDMVPGMIVEAPPGKKAHFLQPSGAGAFEPYAVHQLRTMAIGAGLTYDQLTGDLRQANYSSMRAGRIEFRGMIEEDQWLMLIPIMCEPVWEAFIAAAIMVGLLEPRAEGYPVEFMPPRVQLLDPAQDIPALRGMRRMGLETWAQQVMSYGNSPRQQARDLASENEIFDDLGLILDGDPRRISLAGGAQDPKQNAAIEIAATGAALPRQPDQPQAKSRLPAGYRRRASGLLLPN